MNFVRKSVLVIITPIFTVLLFATAFDMGVLRVAGQPSNIKQILADSGIYNSAVTSLLDQAKQVTSDNDSSSVSLTNPIVRSAAATTFSPQFLQSNTEKVIDSVYAWLDGKTATPDFSIDLTNAKGQFATTVSQAVEKQAAGLPVCTAAQIPASFDALSATCLPPGVTPAAAASEVQGDILGGKGFLDNPVITANTVKNTSTNQPIFTTKLKDVPKQYQRLKKTPIILSVLTLLAAVAIVFLSSSRRKGLRHVGITLVVIGLLMLLLAWGLSHAVSKEVIPNLKLNNAVLQTDVGKVITDVAQKVSQNYQIFGGVYAVLGVLAIVAAMFWGGRGAKDKDDLEGEGKNKDDRIDLREPDRVSALAGPAKAAAKPKPAAPAAKKNIKVS